MRFVDTNILLYSVCSGPLDSAKSETASLLLESDDLVLSVQVLQEFYVQATRSSRTNRLSHDTALAFIRTWQRFPVQENTLALLNAALAAKQRWHISFWDAAIIEAARASQASELLSEDLGHGQNYGGVRVVNPFL